MRPWHAYQGLTPFPAYHAVFGGFEISDIWDYTGKPVAEGIDSLVSKAQTLMQDVPGGGWVVDAIKGGASAVQWLAAKYAKLPGGQVVLTVITFGMGSLAYSALAPVVGAQAAAVAFAIPGIIDGASLGDAFVGGFTERLKKLAEYYAGQFGDEAAKTAVRDYGRTVIQSTQDLSTLLNPEVLSAYRDLRAQGLSGDAALKSLGLDPKTLTARLNANYQRLGLGVPREDAVAYAINAAVGENVYDPRDWPIDTGAMPASSPNTAHYFEALGPEGPIRKIGKVPGSDPVPLSNDVRDRLNRALVAAGMAPRPPEGIVFGTSPAGAKKARELAVVLAMLAPTALALLLLKLPTKAKRH